MSLSLRDLILAHVPEDGSAIGNLALLALLREQVPGLSDEDYAAAKDDLVAEGLLGKGRGRGGTVFLAGIDDDEDDGEDGEDGDFTLEAQEPGEAVTRKGAGKKKASRKAQGPVQVLSYRHTETRVNNPEVGMVHPDNDPDQPKTVWAYDPHLDPALMFDSQRGAIESLIDNALASGDADVMADALAELKRMQAPYLNWTGKAERTSFEVDTVSLHVHERVDPATILARAAKRLKGGKGASEWRQADLFAAAFENLPLRQAIDFYKHEKGWSNRLIAGDSLLVMNSLLQKESMAGKVQMIYIDPPYGIKYKSNFQPFTHKRDVADGDKDDDLNQEPEMIKAFRDTWELGIHSYLTYLRDRLRIAKELLHDSGSVFVQISDENVHLIRGVLDDIFGSSNFVSQIYFSKTGSVSGNYLGKVCDIILFYAKNADKLKYRVLYQSKGLDEGEYSDDPLKSDGFRTTTTAPFNFMGLDWPCSPNEHWKVPLEDLKRVGKTGRLIPKKTSLRVRKYASDFGYMVYHSVWMGFGGASDMRYVVETNAKVVERCMQMVTDPGDLVLDPTCGSGTTAYVAEKWGRRWITCDTSRIAITLAKQRLMSASFDYYSLRYPHEGLSGGFDYETAAHVTLNSIAKNPDIDAIHDKMYPAVSTALDALNDALAANPGKPFKPAQGVRRGKPIDFSKGDRLDEWEVPSDWPTDWPQSASGPFAQVNSARDAMYSAMEHSISDHAERETLYDKPKKDDTRLRITGPFSVEAVPAPTVLSLDETAQPTEADATVARSGETSRQTQWRDELIRTGIRAKGGAMLKFADLETIPGVRHLHASGTLAETGERVLVSFGPEHAALEQRQVEMALSEAEKLRPAPKFIVFCAFTFDPEAAKDIDEINWPGVTLLKAQMNTDLLTEDLKKARSSNQSFWLMGQPEVELRQTGDTWQVEVHGFDYFDPREGKLISGGKSKIAMWSLDTDYDGRSLMPHQVFFPMAGAKDGWNRLKKTIRAELDEDLLEQFHGTVSLPFEAGDHRRIAVKIVDDRGIESLKIMDLG